MIAWLRRVLAYVRRRRLDAELAEEMRLHIELRTQALVDEGVDPREAQSRARRTFGNATLIRERSREMWRFRPLASLAQDLRFGARMMARAPGYAAIVIATIALGTGLNGAVFVLINAALFRPPDVVRADQVVRFDDGKPTLGPTYPDYVDYRDGAAALVDLAAFATIRVAARIDAPAGTLDDSVTAVLASGNYFDVLGVRALHGRTFTGRDDLPPSGMPVVVLGEDYWARRFGRDPGAIGRTIDLNRQSFTVIGIVPSTFRGVEIAGAGSPTVREIYVPLWTVPLLQPRDTRLVQRTMWWGLQSVGRLRPGATLGAVRGQIASLAADLDRKYPGSRHERTPWVAPISAIDYRLLTEEAGAIAAVFSTATLMVLLIACANVANLTLARVSARGREIAVRLSLGAGRGRIVRQFMTESLMLSVAGTALGFNLAYIALGVATAPRGGQPIAIPLSPDATVIGYAAAIAGLVAIVTGLVPALQASKPGLLPALKDTAMSYRLGRFRAVFIGSGVAISLVLLVTTALLLRSAQRARAIDPLIPVGRLLSIDAEDSAIQGYAEARQAALLAEIDRRVAALPGVTATAMADPVPFSGMRHGTVLRRDQGADSPSVRVFLSNVTPSFFALADLPILRGRVFTARADDEIVVNQALAVRLWGADDPIGQRVTAGDYNRNSYVVVGVVPDAPFVALRLRDEPFMFRPIEPARGGAVVARTATPAAQMVRAATAAARSVDPSLSIAVEPVAAGIDEEIAAVTGGATLAGGLGALALLLALFGVGAMTANAVAQRTHEIGVRMALGAAPSDATALVVRQTIRPVIGGALLGLAAAAGVSRIAAMQLYGLSSTDPVAFASAAGFLLAAALLSAWLPARKAARVDPLVALRAE